ncbi:MAG: HAMP domain-containing protein [Bacteroidales bacterium]|nr:HAMP domain-containing protein [Bacteroidales bacterium]
MSDFFFFAGFIVILLSILIPLVYFRLKKTIIGIIGVAILLISGMVAILAYYIAYAGLTTLVWITPMALLMITLVLLFLRNRLTKPFRQLTSVIVNELAHGRLDFEFDNQLTKRPDELGQVALSLDQMRIQIRDIMKELHVLSSIIVSAATGQDQTALEVSRDANQQAASIEEISSTIEEMAANIETNANNAQETEQISSSAQSGITRVAEKAQASLEASRSIREKIKIVNDIAFQTNILALNAAVEAARAGDHGKGVAVVAAEVRKLAEHSKKAAEEIVNLADTNLSLAETAGEHMQNLIPEILKTTQLVKEISAASQEQTHGTTQVNSAIQQLNSITQQNATSSQNMAKNSKELSSKAEKLQTLISFFQLGKDSNLGMERMN